MAKGDRPDLPPSPLKRPEQTKPRSIDRPMAGLMDAGTPRELATLTRGPIKDMNDVNRQLNADRLRRRGGARDYSKRPLMLKRGRR